MSENAKSEFNFSYKLFNPNFWHLLDAMNDVNLRYIFLYGGSSSAKSYSTAQCILFSSMSNFEDTLVFRKTGASIEDSIFKDFKTIISSWGISSFFTIIKNKITCNLSGSVIDFSGLDDPEKIKGISNYKRLVLEELSEFDFEDFKQIRKRLRGKRGQQIISMFNPISDEHWIKLKVFDVEELHDLSVSLNSVFDDDGNELTKEYSTITQKQINSLKTILNPVTGKYELMPPNMLILRSTYLNNFWVVGSPCGSYGYLDYQVISDFDRDKKLDPDYYRVYALAEWGQLKTGGEFYKNFDNVKHVCGLEYERNSIHLTIDNNRLPYIAIGVWQVDGGLAKQIHEIPCREPHNTVSSAGALTVKYLEDIRHCDKVYVYGDQTTTAGNTIDDDKRSFFDKFCETIILAGFDLTQRLPSSNPSVSISGEFVNNIYAGLITGLDIKINSTCKTSIEDYSRTMADANGNVLKRRIVDKVTKQSYEPYGHFSDTKRYFLCEVFKAEYTKFSLRRNKSTVKENQLNFFENIDVKDSYCIGYIAPDVNGKYIVLTGNLINNKVFLTNVIYLSEPDLDATIKLTELCSETIFEAANVWFDFGRRLRAKSSTPIRIVNESIKRESRIQAMKDYINTLIVFNKFDYPEFLENVLDGYKGDSIEGLNALSGLCEQFKRKYPSL